MNLLNIINSSISAFANFMWGPPLLFLLLGGGLFFSFYSRFVPFKYFGHGFNILLGRYHDPKDPGEITHFQALSSALASTVGLGNIAGVAIAIEGWKGYFPIRHEGGGNFDEGILKRQIQKISRRVFYKRGKSICFYGEKWLRF